MLLDSSNGAQYVTLQKYFLSPSLIIYFFATPPMKLKLRLQIGGSTNSKLPRPIIMINQSKTGNNLPDHIHHSSLAGG
jgi:hypothetical protein